MKKAYLLKMFAVLLLAAVFLFTSGMAAPATASAKASKKDIIRIDFKHYAKGAGNSTKKDLGYKLMGVKWNTFPVTYSLNTSSLPQDLTAAEATGIFTASSEAWDDETGKELFNNAVLSTNKHYGTADGSNTVEFGAYPQTGVIAVTSVWYNRKTKAIVEFDMLYNTYYAWGNADTTSAQVMDLQNIATHELGHAAGLSDIYSGTYSYVTMYGYADYNQTDKRTLEPPDITGLQILYGA